MAVWPSSAFTSGIYRVANPQSRLHLAALFHVSVEFPDWHSEWCSELLNPPPYGRTAQRPSVKDFGTRNRLVALLFALTTMLGCGGLNAGTPAAQSSTGLDATSAVVDFGSVPVGTTQVRANTITNNTNSPVVLTSAQIDQSV